MRILPQDHPVSNHTIKSWHSPTRLGKSPNCLLRTPSEQWGSVEALRAVQKLGFDISVELDRLDPSIPSGGTYPRAFFTWLNRRGVRDSIMWFSRFQAITNLWLARAGNDKADLGLCVLPLLGTHLDGEESDDALVQLINDLVWLHTPRATIRFLESFLSKLAAIKKPRKSLASKKAAAKPPKPVERPKLRLVR